MMRQWKWWDINVAHLMVSRHTCQSLPSGKGKKIITGETNHGTLSIMIDIENSKLMLKIRTDWEKSTLIVISKLMTWSDWPQIRSSIGGIGSCSLEDSWSWENNQSKADVSSQMSTRSSSLSESNSLSDSESELSSELSPGFKSPLTKCVFNVHVRGT